METGTSTSPIKRRLTAILAADAVGYSKQMGIDEEGTLKSLAAQRAIIDRIIVTHQGRIVGTAGDSVLAEFASSVEAVRCAVEIQEALETRNAGVPEAERLVFRIGVNLGDVMVDGADILGDGVNVAARLEGIADPGGICISSSVYDQIAGKLSLGFVDIGEKSLKNIARPIRVYRFDKSGETATARRATAQSRKRWVAVGGVALLALVAAGVWQTGLFERRAAPPLAQTPAEPALAARPPEAASEETKLKLQIAEAERARAEAELARSRADAEAARQRTVAARVERKDAAPLPAPTATPPGVPTPSPKAAAPIAATPAGVPAAAPVAASAPATATAPPAASGPIASTAPSASPPSANSLAAADRGVALRQCDAWEELGPLSDSIPVRSVDGLIVAERGDAGQPGYIRMSGRPDPSGHLVLAGSFISILQRLRGREYAVSFEGGYADGQYVLKGRMGTRTCTVIVRMGNRP